MEDDEVEISDAWRGTPTYRSNLTHREVPTRERHSFRESSEEVEDEQNAKPPKDLEEKHQQINTLFGFKAFPRRVVHRPLQARSEIVRSLYDTPKTFKKVKKESLVSFGNVLWVLLFGWWLFLIYFVAAVLLAASVVGLGYAKLSYELAFYFLWPFGKYLVHKEFELRTNVSERTTLIPGAERKEVFSFRDFFARGVWLVVALPLLLFGHAVALLICWMVIILIPMAKVNWEAMKLLIHPDLQVHDNYPGAHANVQLCTHEAVNIYYYKYTVGGMNIILVNLLPFVVATLVLGYVVPESYRPPPIFLFFTALLSIIPLSYYIGMAVSSISAQSTFAVGAVLNATFGSVVEVILYGSAIRLGTLNGFIVASLTGSMLCTLLLLPGLAMFAGGLKYKEQKFNKAAASVSNILLIVAVIGALLPTIYYMAWGNYTLRCSDCIPERENATEINCSICVYDQESLELDSVWSNYGRPLQYAVSCVLPIAYLAGLLFTLKTHSYIYEKKEGEDKEAEGTPEWSRWKCVAILVLGTLAFSFTSDQLLKSLEPSLLLLGLKESFVGISFIGVVGNSAEIINAINFGIRDNIALSIEIGYAGSIQCSLIQIPFLILFSAIMHQITGNPIFALVFPTLNAFAIIFAVIIVNYISLNGKTNYFEGVALVLVYILFIAAFYFVPV